jgi:hypothetical protein
MSSVTVRQTISWSMSKWRKPDGYACENVKMTSAQGIAEFTARVSGNGSRLSDGERHASKSDKRSPL